MKKTLAIVAIIGAIGSISFVMRDDGIAGRTGSPGETNCNTSNCHVGNSVNAAGGSIIIDAPTLTNWEYVPGQVYPINVTVTRTGINLYGFGFEALLPSGANAGSLSISNPVKTTLKSAFIIGNTRTNVVHQLNGGASAGSATFTFNWTAPATDVGNITFYTAGNAANGNGGTSGDFIYTAMQEITPSTVGLPESELTLSSVLVYPNPASEHLSVSFSLSEPSSVSIRLLTLSGKLTDEILNAPFQSGEHTINHRLNTSASKGVYLLKINSEKSTVLKKVIVL